MLVDAKDRAHSSMSTISERSANSLDGEWVDTGRGRRLVVSDQRCCSSITTKTASFLFKFTRLTRPMADPSC